MNTLAEQYQIMRDLENLLDARDVPSEPRPVTTQGAAAGIASGAPQDASPVADRKAGGTQDVLFGEAA